MSYYKFSAGAKINCMQNVVFMHTENTYLLVCVGIIMALLHSCHHTKHCWARVYSRIPDQDWLDYQS